MTAYRGKKRLGQNFLKSNDVISSIVNAINPKADENIIEIGPGRGALTIPLAESGAKITAIEFDRDLIGYLKKLFEKYDNVNIINKDFLKYEPEFTDFKLVGNLPYNISSPVVEWTIEHRKFISSSYLMVQKEVARRIASVPGSKDWSPLAIFTQLYFDISVCFDIAPKHFKPEPKVTSTLLKLIPESKLEIKNYPAFDKVVRQSFRHRRKTLLNNLIPQIIPDAAQAVHIFEKLNFDRKCRAEGINTEQFLNLTNLLLSYNLI